MINIQPFKAILPKISLISSPDSFFGQVREQYNTFAKAGYFQTTNCDAMYIYQISALGSKHIGLLTGLDIEDYIQNKILKHEQTLAAKEEKSLHLLEERGAMIKPVLLAHRKIDGLEACLTAFAAEQSPIYSISLRGTKHTIWQIKDTEKIKTLQGFFAETAHLYIADGHHRMAAALRLYQKKSTQRYVLAAIFAETQLKIWDYNRVVEGIGNTSPLGFIAKLSNICHLTPVEKPTPPRHKHEFAVHIDGQWLLAAWRKDVLAEYTDTKDLLDVSLLNKKVLEEILDIKDIRTDFRVTYWEGTKSLEVLAVRGRNTSVGFGMFPVVLHDLMQIAEAGGTMPPKSTWFEPRIKNGFIAMTI